jgi:hypothetical protein
MPRGMAFLSVWGRVSAARFSELERGKLFPTLPARLRTAVACGLGSDNRFTARLKPVAFSAQALKGSPFTAPVKWCAESGRWYLNCYP